MCVSHSVHGGVAVGRESLSRGLLCSESLCLGDLCPGVSVSGGSLYRVLCPRGLCPGGAWMEPPPGGHCNGQSSNVFRITLFCH